jgi:hypothetical protein
MKEISAQKLCAGTVSESDTQGGRALERRSNELPGVCGAAWMTALLLPDLNVFRKGRDVAVHKPNYTGFSAFVHGPFENRITGCV